MRREICSRFRINFGCQVLADVACPQEIHSRFQTDILFWNLDILVHTPHPASTWQPKFIRNLLQISLRKNLALSQRIFCTTPKTIRGRLLVYLSNQAAKAGSNYFKIPFDRQGLADYLNVDRSALSKELGKMRDEGILTTRKNAFTLYGLSRHSEQDHRLLSQEKLIKRKNCKPMQMGNRGGKNCA